MSIDTTNEKRFESDIEAFFISPNGGYIKGNDTYDPQLGVYVESLIDFVQNTQPKEWARFKNMNKENTERKFCVAFNNACDMYGLISVLRHGFKHRGIIHSGNPAGRTEDRFHQSGYNGVSCKYSFSAPSSAEAQAQHYFQPAYSGRKSRIGLPCPLSSAGNHHW